MEKSSHSLPSISVNSALVWRLFSALLGGLIVFFLVIGAGSAAFGLIYQGRIFPGLQVGWVDVGGKTPQEAAADLAGAYHYPHQGTLALQDGDQTWYVSPADLGFYFSENHNAELAFNQGRQGGIEDRLAAQVGILLNGRILSPRFVVDERTGSQTLSRLAEEIDQPVVEASLALEGTDVRVQPGQIGRRLDLDASLEAVETQLATLEDGVVPLVVEETRPEILDVSAQADQARQILEDDLVLQIPEAAEGDPGPWVISPEELVEMMIIERVEGEDGLTYRIALDSEQLHFYLEDLAPKINRSGRNARMVFNENNGSFRVLSQEVVGQQLNVEESIARVQEQLAEGVHRVDLVVEKTRPPVTDVNTPEELGITELVSEVTTYFYGSSAERINNIKTAASRFHGVFVAPGETFSMGEQLGDVSLEAGYSEAWIIYGDRTIKGVGGGVCQVSTTLFRAAFFGGYPIVERYSHAYRVTYYEQTASGGINPKLAGLDATVYFPLVDFKFKNDTEHWLLMETYVNAAHRTLTWKFYSTSDGRTVDWSTTGLKNKKDPPDPVYEEKENLKKGQIKQVDWAVEGGRVTVTRHVYRNGNKLWTDTFKTVYQPWAAVCQYGPGTEGMPPEEPRKKNPCKPD